MAHRLAGYQPRAAEHSVKRVAIGHRAVVHGAAVHDDCLIEIGAIVLNGVVVGSGSIVGAGAVCKEGMIIPPNSLVVGVPARVVCETTTKERERIARTVQSYLVLQEEYKAQPRNQRRATAPHDAP